MSRLRLRDPQGYDITVYKARHGNGEVRIVIDPPDANLATRQYILRNGALVEVTAGLYKSKDDGG